MDRYRNNAVLRGVAMLAIVALSLLSPLSALANSEVRGKHGMIASQHELASEIGINILKKGGNAVDAAIAVGIALAVVFPEAGNLGGGGFMLIRDPKGNVRAIDYREKAPAAAVRNLFIDEHGELIKGEGGSTTGYRASGVPGTLAGFDLAFRKYGSGKIKWTDLVEPARRLAQNGYFLSDKLANRLRENANSLSKYPDSKRIFLRNGDLYQEGELFKQPDLANTLGRIARSGPREFYTGATARMIAEDMKAHDGLISLEDLKNYQATEREPIRGNYRGNEIISMPPPSSGGIVLIEILNMLESYDVKDLGYNSAAKYHLVAEAMRRAFADRAEYMGDADFVNVPIRTLISKEYAAERRANIEKDRASSSRDVGFGDITGAESMDTTNFAVVDKDGMAVVNTYTINDLYGSSVTASGTGVLLNDEMDDFSSRPGTPNMYGLIQGDRNSIQPGKRPLSSMTPAIVLRKDGSFWFGVGARGGPRIISAVTQIIIDMIDHKMDLQDAIDAPRIHHQWLPDQLFYEPLGMSPDTIAVLSSLGHRFADKPIYIASATAVMVDEDGTRLGAIDHRSDGKAIGY